MGGTREPVTKRVGDSKKESASSNLRRGRWGGRGRAKEGKQRGI